MAEFEPKIIGFLCNWCTSAAADLAGTTRTQYPPNIHPVRVMCSGTVDPAYVVKALLSGADAVMVGAYPHLQVERGENRRKLIMSKLAHELRVPVVVITFLALGFVLLVIPSKVL